MKQTWDIGDNVVVSCDIQQFDINNMTGNITVTKNNKYYPIDSWSFSIYSNSSQPAIDIDDFFDIRTTDYSAIIRMTDYNVPVDCSMQIGILFENTSKTITIPIMKFVRPTVQLPTVGVSQPVPTIVAGFPTVIELNSTGTVDGIEAVWSFYKVSFDSTGNASTPIELDFDDLSSFLTASYSESKTGFSNSRAQFQLKPNTLTVGFKENDRLGMSVQIVNPETGEIIDDSRNNNKNIPAENVLADGVVYYDIAEFDPVVSIDNVSGSDELYWEDDSLAIDYASSLDFSNYQVILKEVVLPTNAPDDLISILPEAKIELTPNPGSFKITITLNEPFSQIDALSNYPVKYKFQIVEKEKPLVVVSEFEINVKVFNTYNIIPSSAFVLSSDKTTLESINWSSFEEDSHKKTLLIQDSVTTIGSGNSLLDDRVTTDQDITQVHFSKSSSIATKKVMIQDSAFAGCSNLDSFNASPYDNFVITSIGQNAFKNCSSLKPYIYIIPCLLLVF